MIRRDRIVLIAGSKDTFTGTFQELMQAANGQIAAPSGVYRSILDENRVRYIGVDDQRGVARMVAVGRIRFGIVIGSTMNDPEVASLPLRIVKQMPELDYWFTCNRDMSDDLANRLIAILNEPKSEELRALALDHSNQNSAVTQ